MSTAQAPEWPHAVFMAWLDQLKDSLELPSDMQLAERAGIASPSVISGWRRGRTQPGPDNLRRIARLAGIPPIEVFRIAGVVDEADLSDAHGPAPDEPLPRQLRELVELYRRSDKSTRTVILGQVDFLVNAMTKR